MTREVSTLFYCPLGELLHGIPKGYPCHGRVSNSDPDLMIRIVEEKKRTCFLAF